MFINNQLFISLINTIHYVVQTDLLFINLDKCKDVIGVNSKSISNSGSIYFYMALHIIYHYELFDQASLLYFGFSSSIIFYYTLFKLKAMQG